MTKEMFIETLNFLQEREEKEYQINQLLEKEFPDSNIFFGSKYQTHIVKMLEDEFEYQHKGMTKRSDWISYFIYELNFGAEGKNYPITFTDANGGTQRVVLDTPEHLYEFLISEKRLDKYE